MKDAPVLLAHIDIDAAQDSARDLRAMGPAAIRLLRACVEQGEVRLARESLSALALEAAGFVAIRQGERWMEKPVEVIATLTGDEALLALDGPFDAEDCPCVI